jgi:hypothetical protein
MILKIRKHQQEESEVPVEFDLEEGWNGIRLCAYRGVEKKHVATVLENGVLFLHVCNELEKFGFRTKPNGEIKTI